MDPARLLPNGARARCVLMPEHRTSTCAAEDQITAAKATDAARTAARPTKMAASNAAAALSARSVDLMLMAVVFSEGLLQHRQSPITAEPDLSNFDGA